jgi:hypothetical protein
VATFVDRQMTDRTDAELMRQAAEPAAFSENYRRHAPATDLRAALQRLAPKRIGS